MEYKDFILEHGYKYTAKEIQKLFPNISLFIIRYFSKKNGVKLVSSYKDKTQIKEFLKNNGHNFTLDELVKLLPEANRAYIAAFCLQHDIIYKKVRHTKATTRRNSRIKNKTRGVFFNVKNKHNWLIG